MKVMDHEVATLRHINKHEVSVCKLVDMMEDEETLVLVLDYCEGG